jgi:AcrR family transcriptional regulator
MTNRPGWSVARLARESGVHRATIFKWIGNKGGVTMASVRAIATAVDDDPENALRAAAGKLAMSQELEDDQIAEILTSGLPTDVQQDLIEMVIDRRRRDEARQMEDLRRVIGIAKREAS